MMIQEINYQNRQPPETLCHRLSSTSLTVSGGFVSWWEKGRYGV
jgi:hypothetical protein